MSLSIRSRHRSNLPSNNAVVMDHNLQSQIQVLSIYSLLAFLSLASFGALHALAERQILLGYLEIAGAFAIALNFIGLHLTRNATLARICFLLTIMAMLIVMLATGGTQGTGIFWFYVFPLCAFFLAGKKQGAAWVIGLFTAVFALLFLSRKSIVELPYSFITIRQLLISLLVVSIGIYVHQASREKAMEEVERAKSEFLALASHQLRTPISAIKWTSELLLHGDAGKLTGDQREYVEQIYTSNERSTAMVDAMLLVSRLELRNLDVHVEVIDVPAFCHKLIDTYKRNESIGKELLIEEQYAPELPQLSCDPDLLKVLLQNLLSNAVKYTPGGGKIYVSVAKNSARVSPKSQGSISISIKDTGYGIPKKEQKDVFAKMFRTSNIKAKDTDGTGLGLFIVKTILDQVGGQVQFESEEGKGSTFTILLPIEGMRGTPLKNPVGEHNQSA